MIMFIIHLIQQHKIKKALEYQAYGASGLHPKDLAKKRTINQKVRITKKKG